MAVSHRFLLDDAADVGVDPGMQMRSALYESVDGVASWETRNRWFRGRATVASLAAELQAQMEVVAKDAVDAEFAFWLLYVLVRLPAVLASTTANAVMDEINIRFLVLTGEQARELLRTCTSSLPPIIRDVLAACGFGFLLPNSSGNSSGGVIELRNKRRDITLYTGRLLASVLASTTKPLSAEYIAVLLGWGVNPVCDESVIPSHTDRIN